MQMLALLGTILNAGTRLRGHISRMQMLEHPN